MNVTHSSPHLLHLSVSPGIKSWSIFVGIMSIGIGASYYSPDEHILLKVAYLTGCLILGLTFLDDWEDCVFDKAQGKVKLMRRNWCQQLLGFCFNHNSLVLETSSIMAVRAVPVQDRLSAGHQVVLVLRAGGTVPVAETCEGPKSEQEALASRIRHFLALDRVEAVSNSWGDLTESDEEDFLMFHPPVEVECLKGSGNIDFEDIKEGNEVADEHQREESESDSSEELFDDL